MQTLLNTIKHSLAQQGDKPFTVYSSIQEQVLLNVPIVLHQVTECIGIGLPYTHYQLKNWHCQTMRPLLWPVI